MPNIRKISVTYARVPFTTGQKYGQGLLSVSASNHCQPTVTATAIVKPPMKTSKYLPAGVSETDLGLRSTASASNTALMSAPRAALCPGPYSRSEMSMSKDFAKSRGSRSWGSTDRRPAHSNRTVLASKPLRRRSTGAQLSQGRKGVISQTWVFLPAGGACRSRGRLQRIFPGPRPGRRRRRMYLQS